MVTSTRQGKNDHKGDSEINRAASSVTKGETCFQQARWPLPKDMKAGPPKNMGMRMPSRAAGAGPSPQWVIRGQSMKTKKIILSIEISWSLLYYVLDLLGTSHPSFFPVSSFRYRNIYPMSVQSLNFGSTKIVCFHRLTAGEDFASG